jgi:hypothetical protein
MTGAPEVIIFTCSECDRRESVKGSLGASMPCICGGVMSVAGGPSKPSKNVVQGVSSRAHRYEISFIVEAMMDAIRVPGEKTEVNMGRAENIEGIKVDIMRKAILSGNPKVPKIWAVANARRINVMQETAIDYVKSIDAAGIFGSDGTNFIVDIEKAKKYIGPEQTHL